VTGIDSHLPAVCADQLGADAIRQRFGREVRWSPEFHKEERFTDRVPTAAAVLVPLVVRDGLHVLLTQRTAHLNSHSGQIAFPGGKVDPEDRDAAHTALREAQEEVGLDADHVEVIGNLPEYATGSGFVVTPVLALVSAQAQFTPNPHEVADVFEVPLQFLMDPANHRHHAVEWAGRTRHWMSMPYYQQAGPERFIWGATAAMLRNLYRYLSAPV
jgi:8-oxo-dGTP pyrophosphatase MutT (NUDIX family)